MGKEPLDDDLVQKAAAGCESAFKALLVASYDNIYRMAWRWVGSRAEAEAGRRTCHKRPQRLCEIVVGEKGKVTGMVAGQQVVIRGTVSGVVCGKSVALQTSSQVDGDVHHMSFAIEQGAQFEGRSRRARGEPDLLAVVEQRPGAASA